MSNYRAIATVTKVLERVLQGAAVEAVPGAQVRTGRPEPPGNGGAPAATIDLYLYRVETNAALRNADVPTRRSDGTLIQRPRVALDLHYLLTFRGDELRLEPQRLLGNAMRALHAAPVLSRDEIETVVQDPALDYLLGSDLADAVELVKVTPVPLSLEELSKLWSVFFQIPYNLSVAYEATVVVIEGQETPRRALPVVDRRVYVIPLEAAVIEEVTAAAGGPIVAGSTLVLRGRNLRREITRVSVRGVVAEPSSVSATEVRVPLVAPPFPAGALRAGVQGVAVVHPLAMGEPPVEHAGFESNVAAFVLCPRITLATAPDATHVNVTVEPALQQGQRAVLLLNGVTDPAAARAFTNPAAEVDTTVIGFDIAAVPPVAAGQYHVRAQVDGAESPWAPDPASPWFVPPLVIP